MARARIGKEKWDKTFRRGLASISREFRRLSQLRSIIQSLIPDDANGEGMRILFQINAYIDSVAEETTEQQQVFIELWKIAAGEPLDDLEDTEDG